MVTQVGSFVLQGIDAVEAQVEVHISPSQTGGWCVVGLPDTAVRESVERVRAAILNSGYRFPFARLTVNLAPGDVRKEGPVFDLPIAVAVLHAAGTIDPEVARERLGGQLMAGELALDGALRPVRGAVSLALLARRRGYEGILVPSDNGAEAAIVDGIEVRAVSHLRDVVSWLCRHDEITPRPAVDVERLIESTTPPVDFAEVRGQEAAKRALTVAAAGGHNAIMLGPAGTGKTMMARALPGVLPPMTRAETLEVTAIASAAGVTDRDRPLVTERPVRAPHHTASAAAIVGGGTVPRPGEVSLAHRGILFLDELPEFARSVLETMRQPLEDGMVTIARTAATLSFPARFMLVAALNPTPRGDMASDATGRRDMRRYLSRISGPLVDRIDIHVEVPRIPFATLSSRRRGTTTAMMREEIRRARGRQSERQGAVVNADLRGESLDTHLAADEAAMSVLREAMSDLELSARAYDKIRRVARTIADLAGTDRVGAEHVAEAVQYRLLDRLLA